MQPIFVWLLHVNDMDVGNDYQFVGPFDAMQAAVAWAEQHAGSAENWQLVRGHPHFTAILSPSPQEAEKTEDENEAA